MFFGFSGLTSGLNWIKLGLQACHGVMPGLLVTDKPAAKVSSLRPFSNRFISTRIHFTDS